MQVVEFRLNMDFEDLNLRALDLRSRTREIVVPCCEAKEGFADPCVAIRIPCSNTEHCVAWLAQSFDALAIKSDQEQTQSDVGRGPEAILGSRHAYSDRD